MSAPHELMSCLIYYITDRSQFRGNESGRRRALLAKVVDAARAGVDYIQLREKDLSARELEGLAQEAMASVRENSASTRLLINSRTDVALAVGADGVHLRSVDIAPDEVRQTLRVSERQPANAGHFFVTVSCHSAADVFRAESDEPDFAIFAPVFGKGNYPGTQPAGLGALHEASAGRIPVFALGGITLENAASCVIAGAAGVAAIRLFQENKIEGVVRVLRAL